MLDYRKPFICQIGGYCQMTWLYGKETVIGHTVIAKTVIASYKNQRYCWYVQKCYPEILQIKVQKRVQKDQYSSPSYKEDKTHYYERGAPFYSIGIESQEAILGSSSILREGLEVQLSSNTYIVSYDFNSGHTNRRVELVSKSRTQKF